MFLTEFSKILEFNAVADSACSAFFPCNRKQSAIHPLECLAMFHPEVRAELPQAQAILSQPRVTVPIEQVVKRFSFTAESLGCCPHAVFADVFDDLRDTIWWKRSP